MPPVALAVAPPLEEPLQVTLESTTLDTAKATGSVTATLEVSKHPLASVIVTEYDPESTPVIDAVVAQLLHT